ncbi:WS/DGAT domain-containing protein [Streptomyces mobaraensis]|uniref:DUF1298 domain-containing protein n=1 Tax=Streptomyces mobaraensis TaxID=35621 RepID=A0A5N5W8W9_STRMB|nr:WS/DGAT domain-containing protein [Streptomyces mobaraensis]KAB7844959.1 DUF1298 domain-containing protein [Streptomyces mobaraensis]
MPLSADTPAPRPGRYDFWARTWIAYERRHPTTPPVIAQAFLCSGIAPSRTRLREMARLSALLLPELAPEGAETDEVLDRHVFEERAERGSGEAGLRAVLGRLAVAPLPATGADLWLVTGYAPGAFALVPRVRHALLDGVGSSAVTSLVGRMLGGSARPPGSAPAPGVPAAGDDRGTASVGGVCRAALVLADVALGVPPAARLARVPDRAPGAPVLHRWTFVRTAPLRPLLSASGASVNDVLLACLAGALRSWGRERDGRIPRGVRAMVPVTLREDADRPADGNRFVGARVLLPLREPDPLRRLAAVATRTRTVRRRSARPDVEALLRRCPDALAAWTSWRSLRPRVGSLVASNVPGPPGGLRAPGFRVDHVVPMLFLPSGHPFSVAFMDYGGEVCVGFTTYPEVGGLDRLPGWFDAAARELCEAAAPGGPVR